MSFNFIIIIFKDKLFPEVDSKGKY